MVERPIKKSERSARPEKVEQRNDEPSGDRGDRRSKGRKGGRGKGRDQEDKKPPVSPALVRGPRPKPKPEPALVSEEPAEETTMNGESGNADNTDGASETDAVAPPPDG